ncbi:signal peptidase II [Oscillospiraceae bacterium OttesenSCG-928-F05]|nr:signal peptidase II [Oscillospiraceae bacterium OttesenSCG-928-F05]
MIYFLISALIVGADQLVKYFAVERLVGAGPVTLIPGVIQLRYAENTGAAFGILKDQRWLFIVITVLAVVAIIYLIAAKKFPSKPAMWSLAMILGGAVGNWIDRVRQGFVVDMLEFTFMNFAIFNVADIFVTVGGVLFCICLLKTEFLGGKKTRDGVGDEGA